MNMYSMIEDARNKALEKANEWADCEEARELLAKIDAFWTLSDRWYGECQQAAKGFSEGIEDAESELDQMRYDAVNAAADAVSNDRNSDEWLDVWADADCDAPTVKELIESACRAHAGDEYLRRFG